MATDAREKIREAITEAFSQFTVGCSRPVCFNRDCFNYPFGEKLDKNKAAVYILSRFSRNGPADPFLLCPKVPVFEATTSTEAASLQLTFKHLDVLGAAFLKSPVTSENPGINFQDVQATYRSAQEMVSRKELSPDWLTRCLAEQRLNSYTRLFLPRALLILLEIPDLIQPEMTETLVRIVQLVVSYEELAGPEDAYLQTMLVHWLSTYPSDHLLKFLYPLQQFITVQICEHRDNSYHQDVIAAVRLLDILNEANKPFERVSYKEFYNDAVNKELEMRRHFINWMEHRTEREGRHRPETFSLMYYPWILDSATKAELLHIESAIEQSMSQRRHIQQVIQFGALSGGFSPFYFLQVRREHLIEDTIMQLVHREESLKQPLKVHFIDEEGVDGGGVQKEFFQLIVRELFDPQFSMFSYYEDTRLYWFNPDTMAQEDEFELVGLILGLAIYNFNILDVHLPIAIYKKLLGSKTTIEDLRVFNPLLAQSLQSVLTMEGDLETLLCRTFEVETQAYGETVHHPLKPGGELVPVTNENKEEYVTLYIDWILNSSIGHGFEAFRRGFLKVCGGEIFSMFRAEELELLVCGNPILDFYELENATIYEDGFSKDSATVKMLWKVVHSLTEEQKKKFLFFVTGSDRAPINGLGSLKFVISRNGPDSDRLMTSHTCFNHLLLPEYSSEKKIRHMLLLAINNSEGFGLR